MTTSSNTLKVQIGEWNLPVMLVPEENPDFAQFSPGQLMYFRHLINTQKDALLQDYEFDETRPMEFVKKQCFLQGCVAMLNELIDTSERISQTSQQANSNQE